jgi:hypothetical protein
MTLGDARHAHLVGSLAAPDARQAMELSLDVLGDRLVALPDGETGVRCQWLVNAVDKLRDHPDLQLRKDGDWSDYDKCPVFKIKRGHKLRADTLHFGQVDAFDESWPIFQELRKRSGREDLAFQQGVPGDLDRAFFVFGPPRCFLHRRPFTEVTLGEIRQVYERGGGDVVFQFEVPIPQLLVAMVPGPLQPFMAGFMARGITNLARRSPPGARFGVHLCVGDLNRKALLRMKDARPIVLLANAIVRRWPKGVPLEYIHSPFAAAALPPPTDERWYAPLAQLDLPASVRFVAGFAHEDQDIAEQRRIREVIERYARRRVDISSTCGLGRRSPEAAKAAVERIAELTGD